MIVRIESLRRIDICEGNRQDTFTVPGKMGEFFKIRQLFRLGFVLFKNIGGSSIFCV